MTGWSGSFSYKNLNSQEFDLAGYAFFIRINRIDDLAASMHFLDENEDEINVPANIRLFTDTNVEQQPYRNSFVITWFGHYTLRDTTTNTDLCILSNQRQQCIFGGAVTHGRTYDENGNLRHGEPRINE